MFEWWQVRRARLRLERRQIELAEMALNEAIPSSLEDADRSQWMLLGGSDTRMLDSQDQSTLRDRARAFFYANPYGRNIIRLVTKYVVGRGFDIIPDDNIPDVRRLLKLFWRMNNMDRRKKEIVTRTVRDGEVFIRKFQKEGILLLRFMQPDLVKDPDETTQVVGNIKYGIETDPNDIETVLAYWYDGKRIPADQVFHHKILVDSDVLRGRSFLEASARYLVYYTEWIDRRVKLSLIRNAVALVKKITGSPTQVTAAATQYETTRKTADDNTAMQRVPKGASLFVANQGVDYEFKTPDVQAQDAQHDGRAILLGVAAGVGMPEFMVTSDASNANFASTMVAEAPGVLEFEDWQDDFKSLFELIYAEMIQTGIRSQIIPAKIRDRVMVLGTGPDGVPIETEIVADREVSDECTIVFPEIVHRDIEKETKAIVMQSNQGWISDHTAAARLDLDFEDERELLRKEAEAEAEDPYSTDEPEEDEEDEDEDEAANEEAGIKDE